VTRQLSVICDFDGTITVRDVGHALCERFAPGALADADRRWMAGEIPFHEAFRIACLGLRASAEQLVEHALAVGALRPGFEDLLDACVETGAELTVASAGLDLYVEPILERALGERRALLSMHVNPARVSDEGVVVDFPHRHADCPECGNCKGVLARGHRAAGRRVLAVGDSFSDRCLVGEADWVFARSWLAEHCERSGVAHERYDDFGPVAALVRELAAP